MPVGYSITNRVHMLSTKNNFLGLCWGDIINLLISAKKYDIRQLVGACVRFLLNGLTASNAVCLLSQARLFEEEMLLQRCFEMIDKHTDTALTPESEFLINCKQ